MINGKCVAVVMPAYNAESTLEATVREIPDLVDIRILVDDHSKDNTAALARQLGLTVFVHDRNFGYGGNQQTCYREALAAGADVVVMVHPDYQYTPLLTTASTTPATGRSIARYWKPCRSWRTRRTLSSTIRCWRSACISDFA